MKSTLWVKRVVLVNGLASGKGRPAIGIKKTRTCLYIPLKETFGTHTRATNERPYNPAKNADQRKQFKRTNISALKPIAVATPDPVVAVNVEDIVSVPADSVPAVTA
jgi:hypothetical protein